MSKNSHRQEYENNELDGQPQVNVKPNNENAITIKIDKLQQ